MHSATVPVSRPAPVRVMAATTGLAAAAAARGTSTENREPRPTTDFNATSLPSTRAMRSTMERPKPTPRATRAP